MTPNAARIRERLERNSTMDRYLQSASKSPPAAPRTGCNGPRHEITKENVMKNDCKLDSRWLLLALLILAGCAPSARMAVREAPMTSPQHPVLVGLFVPAVVTETPTFPEEDSAMLDWLRVNEAPPASLPEHVATALPFRCVNASNAGTCAVAPAR
jgi:hypothetical protein